MHKKIAKKKGKKGEMVDVRRERRYGRSSSLSSPRLASCICHWMAHARDTRGGRIGGRRRVVVDGGYNGSKAEKAR